MDILSIFSKNSYAKRTPINGYPMSPQWLFGDLNKLSSSQEKIANNKGNSTRFTQFKKFLDENGLVDTGFS